jgi:hypothetical protein
MAWMPAYIAVSNLRSNIPMCSTHKGGGGLVIFLLVSISVVRPRSSYF